MAQHSNTKAAHKPWSITEANGVRIEFWRSGGQNTRLVVTTPHASAVRVCRPGMAGQLGDYLTWHPQALAGRPFDGHAHRWAQLGYVLRDASTASTPDGCALVQRCRVDVCECCAKLRTTPVRD